MAIFVVTENYFWNLEMLPLIFKSQQLGDSSSNLSASSLRPKSGSIGGFLRSTGYTLVTCNVLHHGMWLVEIMRRTVRLCVQTCLPPKPDQDQALVEEDQHLQHTEKRIETRKKRKVQIYKAKFDVRITTKYEIKALIGRGSFSRVVRVNHRETREPFAIKVVALMETNRTSFNIEVDILKRVRHPYIIRLYDVVKTRDRLYMVMELATGGELFDRIVSRGHYTERDTSHTMSMLLEGLRYLHTLGIAHRDLKPENLLYYHPGADSKIMITDFGLSSYKYSDEAMRTTCGTPEYIAPEILRQQPYTCAVDLWAVGVITYILLCGRMPFDDDSRARLYRQILRAKFSFDGEPWNDVSESARHFIKSLICLDPRGRLTAEEALLHPWIQESIFYTNCRNLHTTVSSNILKHKSIKAMLDLSLDYHMTATDKTKLIAEDENTEP